LESEDLLEAITTPPTNSSKEITAKKDALARSIIMQAAGMDRIGYILGLDNAYKQ